MKNIFKLLSIAFFFFAFTTSVEAQLKHNKKEKKGMKKQLHLTKQKKVQLTQRKKEKHDKLEVILTPEQKEKMKQMKENTPRRGVTNMPNERTAK